MSDNIRKKNILIALTGAMELGGVEKSLLGLLDSFDYDEFEVDLFLYGHHGALYSLINKNVNILPEIKELAYLRESLSAKLKNGCYYSAFLRILDEVKKKFSPINYDKTWAKVMGKVAPKIDKHYDIALGFFRPFDFINEKVDADIKVGWVHTDYSTEKNNLESLKSDYDTVDYIAAVSQACKESFLKVFPEYAHKTIVIENVLPKQLIKIQKSEFDTSAEMPEKGIKLLSVGRYCTAKNFDNVPEICSKLIASGLDVYWYIIGFGADENLIKEKIKEFGMEDRVVLLGKKENPYPYISACDLYVQPSRYEGKAVTVREAQMLEKPVVITNYATSASQLENGVDGIVVPMDNRGCAEGIAALLNNPEKINELIANCRKNDYSNMDEVNKLKLLSKV